MINAKIAIFSLLLIVGAVILFLSINKFIVGRLALRVHLTTMWSINTPLVTLTELLPNVKISPSKGIEKKIISAGFYDFKWSHYYLPVKYTLAIIGCGVGYYFMSDDNQAVILVLGCWLMLAILGPDIYLSYRIKLRYEKISKKLPYLLDLLAMCVHSGMTIESGLQFLSKELKFLDQNLSLLVIRLNERARLVGMSLALEELYESIPTNEIRSFVMTLKQSLQHGSSIYDVLVNLANDIREIHLLSLEEKVGQLSAKMSIPLILFIMIPVTVLIAAPGIMRVIPNAF